MTACWAEARRTHTSADKAAISGVLYLIASGGVASVEDIRRLETLNIDGVIVGKALYEGRIRLQQLREFTGTC
ncbi:MAG: HisA/HisF-related TIM barrel protein [Candidatus Marinimicrobia bacterium]|nr:HisA/HisF-related TIM barrel protein [Candidatus Neomarinimicrobiota bacterium]